MTAWTIAYRKPRANTFRRVTDWEGTRAQASEMAARFATAHPELQVRTTPATCRTIISDTGRHVRLIPGGTIGALIPDSQEQVRYIPKAYISAGGEFEWGVWDLVTKSFLVGGRTREEAVIQARSANELQHQQR